MRAALILAAGLLFGAATRGQVPTEWAILVFLTAWLVTQRR